MAIAHIRGDYLDANICCPDKGIGDLLQPFRVAGYEAKMHSFSGKFGGDGCPDLSVGTSYQCNLSIQL
jgi:hypothetical protein